MRTPKPTNGIVYRRGVACDCGYCADDDDIPVFVYADVEAYCKYFPCPDCGSETLRPAVLRVDLENKTIAPLAKAV